MTRLQVVLDERSAELPASVRNARAHWTRRTSLSLRLIDAAGHVGHGEAAPLPGFSPDDVGACRQALAALDFDALLGAGDPRAALVACARRIAPELPAARCAAETALLDLIGQYRNEPLWRTFAGLLPGTPRDSAEQATAVLLDADDPDRALDQALAAGARSFKLKVGRRGAFADELATLARLRERLGADAALRLDANGAWSPVEARRHLSQLAPFAPEFVEEPVPPGMLHELGASPVPIALDESLLAKNPDTLARWLGLGVVRVLVLKPMLHGFLRCLELSELAAERQLELVVSHLFDGPVAHAAATALAFALPRGRHAHGLGPHPALVALADGAAVDLAPRLVRSDAPGLGRGRGR